MNEIIERTLLYDFYSELLTEKQKRIYEFHFLEDLSLSEIAENMNISRQGVHDAIKRCEIQLYKYEEKLNLVGKFVHNRKRVSDIYKVTLEMNKEINHLDDTIANQIIEIHNMAKEILEDL